MAEHGSTAQVLASGSQDLAALAGLFATEGVERNALAGHLGYGAIISSGISVLGILGLVKSAVKLSLGLNRCRKSGFNVDSLRGIFGYDWAETPILGDKVLCDLIDIHFTNGKVVFSKKPQYFDTETRAILTVGSQNKTTLKDKTAIIIGNWKHERAWKQSPWIAGLLLFGTCGLTSWLLLVVGHGAIWELWLACAGLHLSLLVLIGAPLYHSFQLMKPSQYLTRNRLELATNSAKDKITPNARLVFTQTHINQGEVLFFHGNTAYVHTLSYRIPLLFFSALCAVSYVCQYTVLKSAGSTRAAIWIGAQAALAVFRVIFWLWDPAFDDPKVHDSRYILFDYDASDKLTPIALARNVPEADFEYTFPRWVWDYLQKMPVVEILKEAIQADAYKIRNNSNPELFFLGHNPEELFRGLRFPEEFKSACQVKWRVVLLREKGGNIQPYIFVKVYKSWVLWDELPGVGANRTRHTSTPALYAERNARIVPGIGETDLVSVTKTYYERPTLMNFETGILSIKEYSRDDMRFLLRWRACDYVSGIDETYSICQVERFSELPEIVLNQRTKEILTTNKEATRLKLRQQRITEDDVSTRRRSNNHLIQAPRLWGNRMRDQGKKLRSSRRAKVETARDIC